MIQRIKGWPHAIRRYTSEHKVFTRVVLTLVLIEVAVGWYNFPSHTKEVHASAVQIDGTVHTTSGKFRSSQPRMVFISDQVGYIFYADSDGTCSYSKTTNGGTSWATAVTVDSATNCIDVAIWYDRWTPGDTTGTKIYFADYIAADVKYGELDTSGDTLTGPTNLTNGTGGALTKTNTFANNLERPSITKGTDGKLYIAIDDDGTGEDSFVIKCSGTCTTASNWSDVGTSPLTTSTNPDSAVLLPLASGSIMLIRKNDGSGLMESNIWNGSTWSGYTTIASGVQWSGSYRQAMAATLDKSTNDIYLAFADDNTTIGTDDDIDTAVYSGGSWTSKTAVITNSDSGSGSATQGVLGVSIAYDQLTNHVFVAYRGAPATWPGASVNGVAACTGTNSSYNVSCSNTFWRESSDGMTTWRTEHNNVDALYDNSFGTYLNVMSDSRIYAAWEEATGSTLQGDTLADLDSAQNTIDTTTSTVNLQGHDGNAPSTVFISDQTGYTAYRDSDGKCVYSKTTNGGTTWSAATALDTGTSCLHVSLWYDRWTPRDNTGAKIYFVMVNSTSQDLLYTAMDTSNSDSLSTVANLTNGASGAPSKTNTFSSSGSYATISKGTNGHLYIGVVDAGTSGDQSYVLKCSTTCSTASNWSDTSITLPSSGTTGNNGDTILLEPLASGDMIALYCDITNNTVESSASFLNALPLRITLVNDGRVYSGITL